MKITLNESTNGQGVSWPLRSILAPLLSLPIVTGLILPWERGYQWSSSGWDTGAGRLLAVLTFVMAWMYVIHVAGGLNQVWYLSALSVLALSAVGLPVAFYALDVGRRDPGLVDGFRSTHPGLGLATTFVGGLALGIHVLFQWWNKPTTLRFLDS